MGDFRFQGTIFQKRGPPGLYRRQNSVLRSPHAGDRKADSGSPKAIRRPGLQQIPLLLHPGAHGLKYLKMQVDGPRSNGAASRIRNPDASLPSQKTSHQHHRGAHAGGILPVNLESVQISAANPERVIFPACFRPQTAQNPFHGKNIRDPGTVMERYLSFVQYGRGHHGQRRVFGTLNSDTAQKRASAL